MNNSETTIIVGMSGGVDSSVVAAILKEQGYNVIGMFMKNWDEVDVDGNCPAEADYKDVINVCEKLDIPYYSIDFVKDYWDNVFADFLVEFKKGFTPNPDVLCNREIKFKIFLEKAIELGADYLATGHYCKVEHGALKSKLLKGDDPKKDQSYFLHAVSGEALQKVMFPLGDIHKTKVRELAQKYDLSTMEKKDSTGICFIGERNFSKFMQNYVAVKTGRMQTLAGEDMGEHQGAAFYTLGQRKGLGIGAHKESTGEPWFVVEKDCEKNIVYVEQGVTHPSLYCDELIAEEIHWICDVPDFPCKLSAKVRYRQADQECEVYRLQNGYRVTFSEPQRAVTLGQYVVLYDGNICLGGGVITSRGESYFQQKKSLPNLVTNK